MARILAVANSKGGVGKTTSAFNLAAALTERGRRVLAVDMDPQSSLTFLAGVQPDGLAQTVHNALTCEGMPLASALVHTREGFDLAPANLGLNQIVEARNGSEQRPTALRAALEPLRDRYDYVLIDCPANAGILTGYALVAADEVLIPLVADQLGLHALVWFLSIVQHTTDALNPNLRIAGLFFTMFDPRTRHARQIVDAARASFGDQLRFFATMVQNSVTIRDAGLSNRSILCHAPKSPAAGAYRALARELEEGIRVTTDNELGLVLDEADRALSRQDLSTAYRKYCRATDLAPRSSKAWRGRGVAADPWDEQIRCFGRAVHLDPEQPETRVRLDWSIAAAVKSAGLDHIQTLITCALFLEELEQGAAAAKLFERVIELDPDHLEGWRGKARTTPNLLETVVYLRKWQETPPHRELAKAALSQIVPRAKNAAQRLIDEGIAAKRAGDTEKARLLFSQATELDPQNDRGWLERVRIAGDFQSAARVAKQALEANPDNEQARELCQVLYDPGNKKAVPLVSSRRLILPVLVIVVLIIIAVFVLLPIRLY